MAEIMKTFPINLDLKRVTAQSTPISPLVVGDNGNIFEITLTDGGVPVNLTGCKVFAVFSRPDGQTVEQDTDGNGVTIGGDDNNVLTIDVRTGSYSDGKNDCELQIYSGADYKTLVTSAQFNFDGRRGIVNDETVAAEERYPILVSMISQAEEASSVATSASATAKEAVAQAAAAVESAQTAVAAATELNEQVSSAESARESAEAARDSAESERVAAEAQRKANESERVSAESARASAESERDSAEAAREAAEAVRVAAELERANSVRYIEQSLSDSQKSQARTNISAAAIDANGKVAATQASSRIIDVSANITLAAQHAGCLICAIQSNNTITIPSDADNAIFSIGTEIEVLRYWSQTVTITAASDVYLYGGGSGSLGRSITIGNQHGMIALKKIRANEWLAVGDIG